MAGKKDPGKFTVRFNVADPQQRTAAELLNQQGRCKAQFITNAVLFYVQTAGDGAAPLPAGRYIAPQETAPACEPIPAHRPEDNDVESIRRTMEAFQFSQNNGA